MALTNTLVPSLPPALRQLFDYLLRRDLGGPSSGPVPGALEQTTIGTLELDTIAWDYTPADPSLGFNADGFIVWWARGATTDPTDGGLRVSAASRRFSMVWPAGELRSYAVAAVRDTYQGEILGPKQQDATWRGAS